MKKNPSYSFLSRGLGVARPCIEEESLVQLITPNLCSFQMTGHMVKSGSCEIYSTICCHFCHFFHVSKRE